MPLENIAVTMVRNDLEAIPGYPLPAPYTIRWYQPGDEDHWVDIHLEADPYNTITHALFAKEFGADVALLAERQAYLCDADGTPIGTASAWFNHNYHGAAYGRVHWVAIRPARQGAGLAKPLMTAICHRLRELGHQRVYLVTSTARLPAISLYLKFGFRPEIRAEQDRAAWQQVRRRLSQTQSSASGITALSNIKPPPGGL